MKSGKIDKSEKGWVWSI